MLCLPVESLPTSLKVLCGSRLNIMSVTAPAELTPDHAAIGNCSRMEPKESTHDMTAIHRVQLEKLWLSECHISSPSILASQSLHELDAFLTRLPGGWKAALNAWPNLKKVPSMFFRDSDCDGSSGGYP